MDRRFLELYSTELRHIRETAGEFARRHPKIAGRLALDEFACADPYVERLLEGFAFLAARVQLKLDAQYPRFTQSLLETVYPHYLAPTPSMAVVRFEPDPAEPAPPEGFTIPRGSILRSLIGKGEQTACEYRTSQAVTLWPVRLTAASYHTTDLPSLSPPSVPGVRAGLRLQVRAVGGCVLRQIRMDTLRVFLRGTDEHPMRLYEQLFAEAAAVVVRPAARPVRQQAVLPPSVLCQVGFEDDEALLPLGPRSFQGYRYLAEYFAFPQRFMFVDFRGIGEAIRKCDTPAAPEAEILVLFREARASLEAAVDASMVELNCAPAINLFPKRTDRIHLTDQVWEHHVVPDRLRPLDFEVYEVRSVVGYGSDPMESRSFAPFYRAGGLREETTANGGGAYYSVSRQPRAGSAKEQRIGRRSGYTGSEVYMMLVDASSRPVRPSWGSIVQLGVETLCTNRDLPLHMPVGRGATDFSLDAAAPVRSVRCVAGPTPPRESHAVSGGGEMSWRLISHLTLNYQTLMGDSLQPDSSQDSAWALRELLSLYGFLGDPAVRTQVSGVRSVSASPITRRAPTPGPIAFARGLEVVLTLEESAFTGSGVFLLGSVLDRFFARYVSINSFTETVVRTVERGEIIRWPARFGRRQIL